MSTETQRAEFEEWASIDTRIANIDRYEKTDLDDDAPYKNWDTAFAWSVWQSAQSSQAVEIETLKSEKEALQTAAISVIAHMYRLHEDRGAELGGKVAASRMLKNAMETKEAS